MDREKRLVVESISGAFPCSREPTIFPFSRSNQRSGCLRHSTFGFHILSAMPARSPGAIVGDFANPIERPFFHSLRRPFLFSSSSSPLHATARCFHPFRLPAFRFLSSTTRFFSIDITPSRLPIAGTEKFRATQQFVRFFYWLLSYFRHSKPLSYPLFLSHPLPSGAVSLFRPCPNLCHSLYSSPRRRTAKDNGSTSARGSCDPAARKKGEMKEIILAVVPGGARAEGTSIIEEISAAATVVA